MTSTVGSDNQQIAEFLTTILDTLNTSSEQFHLLKEQKREFIHDNLSNLKDEFNKKVAELLGELSVQTTAITNPTGIQNDTYIVCKTIFDFSEN